MLLIGMAFKDLLPQAVVMVAVELRLYAPFLPWLIQALAVVEAAITAMAVGLVALA